MKRIKVSYPRRRIQRWIARFLGRLVLPLFFRITHTGRENYPAKGPLIVVGNHVAIMEAVLMAVYTPWQVEILGSIDVPHEKFNALIINWFGYIPIQRGKTDRQAMNQALGVLAQKGVIGIFPEGGIWDAGSMRAQSGVAWLSQKSATPILPIGYGGTLGALGAALRFKRPHLSINVGKLIPAVVVPEGKSRKSHLDDYAQNIMTEVNVLVPPEMKAEKFEISNERFELQIKAFQHNGTQTAIPVELSIQHPQALAKFLHRPGILKIFRSNLQLPTQPLEELDQVADPYVIAQAIQAILNYLEQINPYLLSYRFGAKEAEVMQAGLQELLNISLWAAKENLGLEIEPVRTFYSPKEGKDITQIKQGEFKGWM